MATKNKRTPPPSVHSHLPVTPMSVNTDAAGPKAGTGANFSLNNPWGAKLGQSHPPTAPGQPPQPPPPIDQMQGVPAAAQPNGLPGSAPGRTPAGRRPRTGDEPTVDTGGGAS